MKNHSEQDRETENYLKIVFGLRDVVHLVDIV